MSTVDLNGITVGYDDEGEGPALVFVHGHPFNRSMWHPQLTWFSRAGHRVIAPDLRGYGESTVVAGKTPLETFARDIEDLLDRLGVGGFALCGLSMGGQIALECFRLFGDRVRRLVLADTFAAADGEQARSVRLETAGRLLREGMGPYAEEVLPEMITPDNIKALPEVADHVLAMMRGTDAEGAAAALRGRAERPDYIGLLSRVEIPALVIVGADDGFTPVSDARFMHERLPSSILEIIDGAAHLPNLERPAEFNAALGTFLGRPEPTVEPS